MTYYDEAEIRKAIALMKINGELFEIRILYSNGVVLSGYFNDVDVFLNEFKRQNLKGANVYISLNEPKEACFAREQENHFMESKKNIATTGDNDIYAYDWLMIDLDPSRPAKTSSSDEEVNAAKALGNKIYKYMKELGFNDPLTAFSGNGVHLLYRVNLDNTKENRALMEKSLKALDYLFSTDSIEIDKKNFNPSRICKLYGSLAQKGANNKTRPHRMSYVVSDAQEIKPNDKAYLEKLCKVIPEEPDRKKYNNYSPTDFDLDEWLDKYGIRYTKKSWSDADKYVLDECPFDPNHKAPDSCILKFRNGAISFTCFHNSCSGYKWQDLRIKYEPEAYEKKQQYIERQMYKSFNRDNPPEPKHIEAKDGKPVFYSANEIIHRPRPLEQIIKSGITEFDKRYRGLRKKDVTALSGYAGGSKSTLLSQIVLNAVNAGNNVAVFSGELDDADYMKWMNLQAAGKAFVTNTQYENYFEVPFKYQERIANWLEGHFWLYNNDYGFDFNAIIEQLEAMIDTHKLDMLCIDNLMALDISSLSKEKYDAQSLFAWRIHDLAKKKNVHIITVCHPRKSVGLLGMYDISGTSDIVNAVDNIIYVYRANQNFTSSYKQYFGREWSGSGTNVWNCAKVRFGSVEEEYFPLFYEKETKRLKNDVSENIIYGWTTSDEKRQKDAEIIKQIEFEDVTDLDSIPFD
jgi:archaellum biogenesis ATPase FlaH